MENIWHLKKRFDPSVVLAFVFPALLFLLLVLLDAGMRGHLNPIEAGIYLVLLAPIFLIGGLVAGIVAIARNDRPRWVAITGLTINALLVVYVAISLLLSA